MSRPFHRGFQCSCMAALLLVLFMATTLITFLGLQRTLLINHGIPIHLPENGKLAAKGLQFSAVKRVKDMSVKRLRHESDYLKLLRASDKNVKPGDSSPVTLPIVYLDEDIKDFTKLTSTQERIPRILHQTWKTYDIPSKFFRLIKTWQKVNPTWEYWFWTDQDAEKFIELRYPKYLSMYKSYPNGIHRADVMRYFILYEFGGFYADLDIEALKPLDNLRFQHDCLLAQEPLPHTVLFWSKTRLACNALMAARPKHPFFKLVIERLPSNAGRGGNTEVMDKTGPKMIDRLVSEYENQHRGKSHFRNETVYLGKPDAFLPTIAANALKTVKKKCRYRQRTTLGQKICEELKKDKFSNKVPPQALTNHEWVHTYYGIDTNVTKNIFDLVPKAKNVGQMLQIMELKAKT